MLSNPTRYSLLLKAVLKSNGRRACGGGEEYWAVCLRSMGVYEDSPVVLRLKKPDNQSEKGFSEAQREPNTREMFFPSII